MRSVKQIDKKINIPFFSNKRTGLWMLFMVLFAAAFTVLIHTPHAAAATGGVKLSYNGKKHTNKSKQLTVKYDGKTVSKKGYKAIKINKTYMAPYDDIFKKGVKASCQYSKKTKKITISHNQVKLQMTVGSKTAYVNGKKTKMPTAPLSVRYLSKKKTKLLVPVSFVAKNLQLSYQKSASVIRLAAPLLLSYDGKTVYYTGVQGALYYNHKKYKLSTMPVIKIGGTMYMPAEESIDRILKLEYSYNAGTGKIVINNEDNDLSVTCQVNSAKATVNSKEVTLNAPVKVIKNTAKKTSVVCVPASGILKQLGYTRSWDKVNQYYKAQSKQFFQWKKEPTDAQKANTECNYIYSAKASYSEQNKIGSIDFKITGTSADIMKTVAIKRDGKVITVTMPKTKYVLDKNHFSNFGENIDKMEVTSSDDTVTISLTCQNAADYSYVVQGDTLELNVLYTYKSSSGNISEFSLMILKPAGTSIADVSNEDLYAKKKFQVKIKGNHVNYFKSNPVIINNNSVKNVAVSTKGENTVITVKTSSLRGYKIYERGDYFVVSVGAPRSIYRSILVLDAGHGDYDPGATNKGTNEKDLNYNVIYKYMKSYFSQNAPDIKVYWTRTTDTFVTLANRAAFAKSVGADAFVSLHMNSASNTSANGTEVYYSVSNNSKSFGGITSDKMATLFRKRILADLGMKNRGTKSAAYYVLKHNTVPAVLIELGFLSGNSDYSKLTSTTFQKKAAKSIYNGILELFSQYPTGR